MRCLLAVYAFVRVKTKSYFKSIKQVSRKYLSFIFLRYKIRRFSRDLTEIPKIRPSCEPDINVQTSTYSIKFSQTFSRLYNKQSVGLTLGDNNIIMNFNNDF